MFAFLAVVAMKDYKKGVIEPSYILCKTKPESDHTIGYRIAAADSKFKDMTKVLVTSFTGHEDLIEYMTNFRTVRYYRTKRRDRVIVRGMMFWFPCNEYGERTKDPPVFITKVPVVGRQPEEGKQRLEAVREAKKYKPLNRVVADEPNALDSEYFNVLKEMPEGNIGRRANNGRKHQKRRGHQVEWGSVGF